MIIPPIKVRGPSTHVQWHILVNVTSPHCNRIGPLIHITVWITANDHEDLLTCTSKVEVRVTIPTCNDIFKITPDPILIKIQSEMI